MINQERYILKIHKEMVELGMDISILELTKENYESILNAENKDSKEISGSLVLQKEVRINPYTSPVIVLVKMGV